ncbi:MAG: type III pantothenate kinase [Phycisphaerales bacterium]|nr:type III pantothenate kinase [Phycisphaerales bacterium]
MNVNLLAISIGNTRTKLGVFLDGKLVRTLALTDDQLDTQLRPFVLEAWKELTLTKQPAALIASVNPPLYPKVEEIVSEALLEDRSAEVLRIEEDVAVAIGRQLDPEAMVGEDRLLNASAAYNTLQQACVVVDAGTAITVDFIDGSGTFHGGAIAPGATLMLQSLHEHTGQLPEISPAMPEEVIGHNTVQAMRTGMYHGLRGLVRELVEKICRGGWWLSDGHCHRRRCRSALQGLRAGRTHRA